MTFPVVNTGRVRLGGSLWSADVSVNTGSDVAELTCGASMGNAPRDLADYNRHTEFSVVQRIAAGGATMPAELWKSRAETFSLGDLSVEMATCVASLSVPNNLTTGTPDIPGFLFFGVSGGAVVWRHVPANDLDSPTIDAGTVWDNELAVTASDLHVVDLDDGPWLVVPSTSTSVPTQDGLWVRWLGETLNTVDATEVPVDLRPADGLVLDLSRMHAIGHDDRTITVYYRVYASDGSWDGTAVFAFSADDRSVRVAPRLLVEGYIPVVSTCAALRHPVTGEILLALETSTGDAGQEIFWWATRGRGISLDVAPLEWSAATHPNLFGGRWRSSAGDSVVRVCGMGWADNKAGGGFRVFAQHVLGSVDAVYRDVVNTFIPSTANNDTARRALLGEIAVVPIAGDASAAGHFRWLGANASPMLLSDRDRRGYDLELDPVDAVLVVPLDDVSTSTIRTSVGEAEGEFAASTTSRLSPSPGAMRGSMGFNDDDASVEFPSPDATYRLTSVTVTLWVYPRISSAPAQKLLASKPMGTDEAWALYWDDSTQNFVAQYTTTSDGPLSFAGHGLLAPYAADRWYHLTFTYDETIARLYVNGVLVGEDTPAVGGPLDSANPDDPIFLGADGITVSAVARLEELVVGGTPLTPQQVLHNFTHSLTSRTGPVVSSHLAGTPDRVVACLVATDTDVADGEEGPTYTLALREANLVAGAPSAFEHHAVIDVWRRQRLSAPVYLGALPAPSALNDYTRVGTLGYGTNPRFAHANGRWQGKLFRTATQLRAVIPMVSDSQDDAHVFIYSFDPEDIYGSLVVTQAATLDVSATSQLPMHGSDALDYGADYLLVLPRGTADGLTQRVYFVRPADYGTNPWATAAYVDVADLLPDSTETHEGVAFNTDFGDGATGNVRVDGIVARYVEGDGGVSGSYSGDVQLLYGLSSPGTGTTAVTNLVATAAAIASFADIFAGTSPVTVTAQPVQIDEYGRGGIEPFSPIRWLQHPERPSGDTLLLAATGLRPHSGRGVGDGGLDVYALKNAGTWGIRPVCPVPFSHTVPSAARRGVDVAFSVDAAYDYEYTLAVARPYPSAADQLSTMVLSDLELADGGFTLGTAAALNTLVRPSEQRTAALWTDHVVQTRNFTDAVTGGKLHRGTRYSAVPILRWSAPGRPYPIEPASYDSTDFHDQAHPALQGGCHSSTARLVRFWTVSGNDLVPAAGGKQPRLPGSGNYLRSTLVNLGNIRPTYGGTRVAPVGIVDDRDAAVGRYVYLTYEIDDTSVASVSVFDSDYENELDSATVPYVIWDSPPADVEARNSRIVLVEGVLYLYYVLSGSLYFLQLPAAGGAAASGSASLITALGIDVDGRFYAVAQANGRVALYFGDDDTAGVRRTLALVHDPVEPEIVRPLASVYSGASPFPASYAACLGVTRDNLDHTVVMLEPAVSHDGGARHPVSGYLLGEDTGNSWLCVHFTTDGYFLLDQMTLDDLVPFRDAAHAAGNGGRARVRTWPTLLTRVADDVGDHPDHSAEYVLHAAAKHLGRENSVPVATKFRHDFAPAAGERSNDVGGSILTASFDADPLGLSGAVEEKPLYPLLVPGSLVLEPIGGFTVLGLSYSVTQVPANPLAAWELADGNAADGGGGTPNITQEQVHGVKGACPAPGALFVAGWYAVGEPG